MIKKVRLKYFEGHEDSQVEFQNGLNLIIGQSNSGKSSIIRAIACCVANRWDKQMVRTGHTYSESYVQTQKGWVECKRGQGINEWKIYDNKQIKEYKSIGSGVPEQVPIILGMGQRIRGQIKELPNFMFQLQKHYMLSQIDGKKATSNLVARMMDNAIGLGGMEDLIKKIATDLTKDKRKLSDITSNISDIKSRILDEQIFNNYKKQYDNCVSLQKDLQQKQKMFEQVKEKYELYKQKNNRIKELKVDVDIQKTSDEFENIYRKIQLISRYKEIKNIYDENKYVEIIDVDNLIKMLDQLFDLIQKIKKYEDYQKKFKNKQLLYKGIKLKMSNQESEIIEKQNKFQQIKKEIGYCPLCGKSFYEGECK